MNGVLGLELIPTWGTCPWLQTFITAHNSQCYNSLSFSLDGTVHRSFPLGTATWFLTSVYQ